MTVRISIFIALFLFCSGPLQSQRYWEHAGPFVNFPDVLNPPEKPGYKLVLQDEFNGPNFDDLKWNRLNYFGGSGDAGCSVDNLYHVYPDPVGQGNYAYRMEGGNSILQMIARKQLPPFSMHTSQQTQGYNLGAELRPFTTAAFESHEPFKYGYLEVRIKLPQGGHPNNVSMWPAVWLFFHSDAYDKEGHGLEIDLFEIMTNCPREWLTNSWNYGWSCPCPEIPGMDPLGGVGADGFSCARNASFHLDPDKPETFFSRFWTFGLEWDTERIHFFLNNVLVRSIMGSCYTPRVFSKLIINLGIQNVVPNSCGVTNSTMPDAAVMELDYVRWYKRILAPEMGMATQHGDWHPNRHRRMMADVDGDGRADIIGFGDSEVLVSLGRENATGLAFGPQFPIIENLCALQGWNPHYYPIATGDVNGDRKTDIIGFGGAGVYLYVADGGIGQAHFAEINPVFPYFGSDISAGSWGGNKRLRLVGDVNGDGKDDIVGCTDNGVVVALAHPTVPGFLPPVMWTNDFGAQTSSMGWSLRDHRRKLVDVDGDGRKDMVGFHDAQVWVGLSMGRGFAPAQVWLNDLCGDQGWSLQRDLILFGDVDGDQRQDIIAFGEDGCLVAFSEGGRFTAPVLQWADMGSGTSSGDWDPLQHPRKVGDVTGDGRADIIGFGREGVWLAAAKGGAAGGAGFEQPRLWYNEFGEDAAAGAWNASRHVRLITDLDGDRILDVAGFGEEGLFGHESPNCPELEPCMAGFNEEIGIGFRPEDTLMARYGHDGTPLDAAPLSATAFPNPSDGLFTVVFKGGSGGLVSLRVVNALGMVLDGTDQEIEGQNTVKLDLRDRPSAVYFLVIRQGDDKTVVKLSKH